MPGDGPPGALDEQDSGVPDAIACESAADISAGVSTNCI
jgi:hypothetical protein